MAIYGITREINNKEKSLGISSGCHFMSMFANNGFTVPLFSIVGQELMEGTCKSHMMPNVISK
jgi:hypothetical protein